MGILGAMKKGLEIAGKSLLLCVVAMVILFVGYVIIGALLGTTILATKFPPITPEMTPQQINALNWAGVNWTLFIPSALVIFLMGFLLNSFTQGGIVATLKDCATEGKERIASFFGYAVKYCLRLFLQIVLIVIVTIISVTAALLVMTLIGALNVKALVIVLSAIIFFVLLVALIYIAMVLMYSQIYVIFNNSRAIEGLAGAIKFLGKNLIKATTLFVLTGLVYLVCYLVIRQLTMVTFRWPVVSQIIWNLAASYVYLIVSMFMLGSFVTFYSSRAQK